MQNKKILIADDVEMNRDLLTDILEDDYGIETVDDGSILALKNLHKKNIR